MLELNPPWSGKPPISLALRPSKFRVRRLRLDVPYHFLASGGVPTSSHIQVHAEAYRGKMYLGFIDYDYSPARGGVGLGEIEMVVSSVLMAGVGRSLVEHAEDEMRAEGVKSVGIALIGAYVEGFWERMGYHAAHGYPPAWLFMEKDLSGPAGGA